MGSSPGFELQWFSDSGTGGQGHLHQTGLQDRWGGAALFPALAPGPQGPL